jgi:hypothetical protein
MKRVMVSVVDKCRIPEQNGRKHRSSLAVEMAGV